MLDNPKPGKNMEIIMSDPLYEMAKPESETPAKNMEEILKEERKKKEQNKKPAPYRTGSIFKKYPTKFLVGILLFLLYSYLNL